MDKNKNYVRTDLALEVAEVLSKNEDDIIKGVTLKCENIDNIKLTVIDIEDEEGEKAMKKPIGRYVTIESKALRENDVLTHEKITRIFSKQLCELYPLSNNATVLIVGLGNWNVTPDALGPKVVSKVLVTRHIRDSLSKEIDEGVISVSAISPGVMGITGMETAEVVKGIVENIKPDVVIAVDALATRATSRINSTIQMANTGISPGAGLGNYRKVLNKEYLGVDVIAIGVPTVVDAVTLVNDTIDLMIDTMITQVETGSEFYEMLKNLDKEEKYNLINNVLSPTFNSDTANLFVTPKEVDAVIDRLSKIIANAINISVHPNIHFDDINRYIN